MTSSRRKPTKKVTKTVKKMATLAGSLAAVGTMQADSLAEIQYFNNSPITLSFSDGSDVDWDVDGDGEWDSVLAAHTWGDGAGVLSIETTNDALYIATDGTGDDFVRFAVSESVGPSANWSTGSGVLVSFHPEAVGYHLGSAAEDNLNSGDNYIGFRLTKDGGDVFYGWANLNLDLTAGAVTLTEWAYDDTTDAAIHVNTVPEPSSLALLAMGAGGLFAYRARQKKRSAEVTV